MTGMSSFIVNLIVAGAATGVGVMGVRALGEASKSKPELKPIPVKVRKERRR